VEFHDLYSSPNVFQVIKSTWMRYVGYGCTYGESRGTYRVQMGKLQGKTPPGKPRHRWIILIWISKKWDWGGGMAWIDLAQDRNRKWALVNVVLSWWVP